MFYMHYHLVVTTTLWSRGYQHLLYIDKKNEAQKGKISPEVSRLVSSRTCIRCRLLRLRSLCSQSLCYLATCLSPLATQLIGLPSASRKIWSHSTLTSTLPKNSTPFPHILVWLRAPLDCLWLQFRQLVLPPCTLYFIYMSNLQFHNTILYHASNTSVFVFHLPPIGLPPLPSYLLSKLRLRCGILWIVNKSLNIFLKMNWLINML